MSIPIIPILTGIGISAGKEMLHRLVNRTLPSIEGHTATQKTNFLQHLNFQQATNATSGRIEASPTTNYLLKKNITNFDELGIHRKHLTSLLLGQPSISNHILALDPNESIRLIRNEDNTFTLNTGSGKTIPIADLPELKLLASQITLLHELDNTRQTNPISGLLEMAQNFNPVAQGTISNLIRSNGTNV